MPSRIKASFFVLRKQSKFVIGLSSGRLFGVRGPPELESFGDSSVVDGACGFLARNHKRIRNLFFTTGSLAK
jgi:hypothetical protein